MGSTPYHMRCSRRALRSTVLAALAVCASAAPSRAQALVRRFPPPPIAPAELFAPSAAHATFTENPTPGEVPTSMLVGAVIGGGVGLIAALISIAHAPPYHDGVPPTILIAYCVPIGAGVGAIIGYAVSAARGDVRPPSLP